jgi:acetyltransferase-like isoleucine patch superfamily enzyme
MKTTQSLQEHYQRAQREPHLLWTGIIGLINGLWHKLKFRLARKNVRIGRMLRVYGTLRIMGPGSVTMGDNCVVQSKLFKTTAFLTVNPEACIEIGHRATFNGTTIQCFDRIKIGDLCSIADGYLVDSPSHYLGADRRTLPVADLPAAPVILERNVWLSANVVVCHGVTIGANSVVGACSLVRKSIPADSFYAGVPARFIKKVPLTSIPGNDSTT